MTDTIFYEDGYPSMVVKRGMHGAYGTIAYRTKKGSSHIGNALLKKLLLNKMKPDKYLEEKNKLFKSKTPEYIPEDVRKQRMEQLQTKQRLEVKCSRIEGKNKY